MEEVLKIVIYKIKYHEIIRDMIYRYYKPEKLSVLDRRNRSLNYEDFKNALSEGLFLARNSYFGLKPSQLKTLSEYESDIDKLDEFKEYIEELFVKDIELKIHSEKSTLKSSIFDFLPDAEQRELAKDILFDDLNYKYKSDKVKAFLKGGVQPNNILFIMSKREETMVTESYIKSIKEKM